MAEVDRGSTVRPPGRPSTQNGQNTAAAAGNAADSEPRALVWEDILELHVIKKLSRVIRRRWNLPVAFANADGTMIATPTAEGLATERYGSHLPLCKRVQQSATGDESCTANGMAITKLFRGNYQLMGESRALMLTCHAGLREVAVPMILDGRYLGTVFSGGFFTRTELEVESREAEARCQPMGIGQTEVRGLIASTPTLTASDVEYLTELMELVATEVVTFQAELSRKERRLDQMQRDLITRYSYDAIIGKSRPMQDLYRLLDKVIDSDSTVLIQGENGTGKELIAKAIHYNSSRKNKRFVIQNCSAFNDNLLDSELFGHKKGAFTGAISDKQGLFEVADGGTFFLDEIGDMSPSLQVKLLRVLQEGTFISVGDTSPKKVDVRIIAATNRDLKKMVEKGEFREDLYYRINVINIVSPPLRDRKDDIPILVEHFLKKHAKGRRLKLKKLSKGCLDRLIEYVWPGNIRELENEIERLVVLAGEERLIADELLSARIRQTAGRDDGTAAREANTLPAALEALEKNMIYEGLKRNHWNKTKTAAELGISRRNLIRKVNSYKLDQRRARAS
jgi:two-component system response regulator HupR/HoxA